MNIVLAELIIIAGAFLQSSFGYGLGVFAVPLLLLIDPGWIPGPLLTAGIILTLLISKREVKALEFYDLRFSLPAYFLGTLVASAILNYLPQRGIILTSGALILLGVLLSSLGISLRTTPGVLLSAGTLSGLMSTLTSAGGAPMALVYQNDSGPRVRATLSGFFTIGSLLSIIILVLIGHYKVDDFIRSLILIPGVFLGFMLSRTHLDRFDGKTLRIGIMIISSVSGVLIILQSI